MTTRVRVHAEPSTYKNADREFVFRHHQPFPTFPTPKPLNKPRQTTMSDAAATASLPPTGPSDTGVRDPVSETVFSPPRRNL